MADAAIVLVCAHDGPMPQTRFVLRKALGHDLKLLIVVNKVDRKDSRAEEVPDEVLELLIDLGAPEELLDSPVLFASAKEGRAATSLEAYDQATDLTPILDAIVDHVPPPQVEPEGPVQLGVCQLEWDDYVGRLVLGRLQRGHLEPPQQVVLARPDRDPVTAEVKKLYRFEGLNRVEVPSAAAGEIVFLSGLDKVEIGDTVCAPDAPDPLPVVSVDPPTVAMHFVATDSPFRGREGERVTSRQVRDRLMREARANVAMQVLDTDSTDQLEVRGRGLLHLGILVEEMRREGYEFSVSRPQVIEKVDEDGQRLEPIELAQIDVPEAFVGKVIELLGARKGELRSITPRGDQSRVELTIPARGLIGIRNSLLNVTNGEANLSHQFLEYGAWRGALPERKTGVLVAMETGKVTAYAIEALESRGQLFVSPGEEVYVGQIVGEHRRPEDLDVNASRKRQTTNMRSATAERKVVLAAPRSFGVEDALAYIAADELVEVTPKSIRLRKRLLNAKARKRAAKAAEAQG
jgi:GTP-binding protein